MPKQSAGIACDFGHVMRSDRLRVIAGGGPVGSRCRDGPVQEEEEIRGGQPEEEMSPPVSEIVLHLDEWSRPILFCIC